MQPIDFAYEVCNLQPSREGALPKNEEPNNVLNIDQHEYLKFHHPEDAFAKNLRGYVSTVMPALKCRMDMRRTQTDAARLLNMFLVTQQSGTTPTMATLCILDK